MTSRGDSFVPDGGYATWMRRAMRPFPSTAALRRAVGGDFEAIGAMQREILRHYGLQPDSSVVDVGCGVGRTARALEGYLTGPYLGTESNPTFLRSARRTVRSPNFTFSRVRGLTIPAPDASVDIVCFFSVLTHLLHEQSYLYLREARRVLKPGGRIVFSFLEFACPTHWTAFEATIADEQGSQSHPLNVFVERDAIRAWAQHLDLAIVDVRSGTERFVPLEQPVTLDRGEVMSDFGSLGQSVCVLERPASAAP